MWVAASCAKSRAAFSLVCFDWFNIPVAPAKNGEENDQEDKNLPAGTMMTPKLHGNLRCFRSAARLFDFCPDDKPVGSGGFSTKPRGAYLARDETRLRHGNGIRDHD